MRRSCCVVRVVVWSVVVAWILQEVHLPRTQAFLAWPWAVAVVLCWWLLYLALLWVLVAPCCPVVAPDNEILFGQTKSRRSNR